MEKVIEQVEMWEDTCDVCGHKIRGHTQGQIQYNMNVHKVQKHGTDKKGGKK